MPGSEADICDIWTRCLRVRWHANRRCRWRPKTKSQAIWHDRHLFQDALAQLPQTLCHTDAFRRNILHRKDDVVLLDWALASLGAPGEELVCLVAVSLYYEGFSAEYADQLDRTVFAGYIAGLRQAGWTGDPETGADRLYLRHGAARAGRREAGSCSCCAIKPVMSSYCERIK